MNINKFTQKSMEAVQNCEKLAYEYGNQQIDEQHLLYSLLTLEDSLILKLITKMGIQGDMFSNEAKQAVERLPKVSGSGQLYISSDLNKVLISGEDEAKAMGDEYVSVEHLFLSLLKHPNKEIKALFKLYNITRETFLQALSTVRGNQRVVSDNPEATYDTLAKYGYDLVERAMDYRTGMICAISLCGFANFSSLGICVSGIAVLCPEKKSTLARLVFKAMLGGVAVSLISAMVVGLVTLF